MLSFERLRVLHAVATHRSVNAAAAALHVTPSAVSQQIAKLEREVGQRLLERNGRSVRLTDAAAVLVSSAQQVLALLDRAEAEFDEHRTIVSGHITVAAFATAARGLVPSALKSLRNKFPQLGVAVRELEPPESIPLLARGDLDLVIAQDWEGAPRLVLGNLSKLPLLDDTADVALPDAHPMARRKIVHLDDLGSDGWITWEHTVPTISNEQYPSRWYREWLIYTLRSRGHQPRIVHTVEEQSTQLALVAAGLGICIVPRLGRDPIPPGVRIVTVRPTLRRHIYAVWCSANTRRNAIGAAVEAFRRSAVVIGKSLRSKDRPQTS